MLNKKQIWRRLARDWIRDNGSLEHEDDWGSSFHETWEQVLKASDIE